MKVEEQDKIAILVIDDSEEDRQVLKWTLKRSNLRFDIFEAERIDEALKMANETSIDCAFVDYQLQGTNGLTCISTLKNAFPHLPMIMLTGQGDEMIASLAMKSGASDYIPKDLLDPSSLRHIVESTLEKSQLKRILDKKQEELEIFSHVLAHDLRSPISSILQIVYYILEFKEKISEEELIEKLKDIKNTSEYVDDLIKTMYSFAQLETDLKFEELTLQELISIVITNLQKVIEEKKCKITYDKCDSHFLGNRSLMIDILQNLVSNGIKYNESSSPTIQISLIEKDNYWEFQVSDNGKGIPEESLNTIFKPFERIQKDSNLSGLGLGLTTCKKIVERHKGTIKVESDGKNGSTFIFTIAKDL